jgi:hypothetical protein
MARSPSTMAPINDFLDGGMVPAIANPPLKAPREAGRDSCAGVAVLDGVTAREMGNPQSSWPDVRPGGLALLAGPDGDGVCRPC